MPYFPSKPPPTSSDDGTALGFYLEDELSRLASSLLDDVQAVELRPAHSAPLRPREGMVVYADGTDWNPGSGEGLYTFGSDAAWHLRYVASAGHVVGEPGSGSAVSGEVGEYGTNTSGAVALTTATAANVISITVPAGDFDIWGYNLFSGAGATSSSDWNSIISGTSTPSVAAGNSLHGATFHSRAPAGLDFAQVHTIPSIRVSNASPKTYYLHAQATFTVSTYSVSGALFYRRMR